MSLASHPTSHFVSTVLLTYPANGKAGHWDNQAPSNIPIAFTDDTPLQYDSPFIDPTLGKPIHSLSLLPDENLHWEFRGDGFWHVCCNLCRTMVNTGNGRAQRTGSLETHQTGKLCRWFRWNPHVESPCVEAVAQVQAQTLREALLPPSSSPNAWSHFLATGASARTPSPSPDNIGNLFVEVITPHRYGDEVYLGLESSITDMDVNTPIWLVCSPRPLDRPLPRCSKILLDWPCEKFFETYPFQHHRFMASALGYHFCLVEKNGTVFWVWANGCMCTWPTGEQACVSCINVREKVAQLATMAHFALPHTNHAYLTHEQLRELLWDCDQTLRHWKLKCATALQKLDDYHHFVMAIATADIPHLHQLMLCGMKEKASIGKIISHIEDALTGAYQAWGYSSDDHDMALLVLHLGGRKLLYVMSQYIALPSLRSLRHATMFTNLMPSLGAPKLNDILFNIKQLFLSRALTLDPVRPFSSGVVLMWDEVNIEETACYFPHADSVGSFCCEHSATVNTCLSTFDTVVNLTRRLFEGTLHYGKEASVIAISSFRRSLQGAYPLLVSLTCKAESPHNSGVLLSRVQFMKHPIGQDHALFPYLGHLPGLNLLVGDGDITGDFDWKHKLNNTIINYELFKRHLRQGDRMETEVEQFMNPADSQDVPHAIEFLEAIEVIGSLPTTSCDPAVCHEAALIGAVGELFVSFIDAFICPDWSLTEQLTALSKFAHASFAFFRHSSVNFMPKQLYGDMQTTVKNAYFCVAKQQLLDDSRPFYLFWLGDDHLETLFGRVCIQGGHNPNFSFKQLLDQLGAAMDLDAIFARHPHLDSGFRRLKITRTEHLDHLNPKSWCGCAMVNKVSLESAWMAGRSQAEQLLVRDLFCQCPDGSWPGMALDEFSKDQSLEPQELSGSTTIPSPHTHCTHAPPNPTMTHSNFLPESLTALSEIDDHTRFSHGKIKKCRNSECWVLMHVLAETYAHFIRSTPGSDLEGLDLEDVIEDPDAHTLPRPCNVSSDVTPWVEYEVITPDYTHKSHERVLHVRGYTSDSKPRPNYDTSDLLDANGYMVGDLFTALIRCKKQACIAVLKTIAIEEWSLRVEQVLLQNLAQPCCRVRSGPGPQGNFLRTEDRGPDRTASNDQDWDQDCSPCRTEEDCSPVLSTEWSRTV
ncbi:hypothetical protein V8D89_008640 [Ganoderma adspersum]